MWENIRTMDDLSLEEAQELAAELAKLSKQQADSLQTVTYIPMFREQAENFDARRRRISEIWEALKEFRPVAQT
jgi:hypothetical protein